jgi:hypothetical protein
MIVMGSVPRSPGDARRFLDRFAARRMALDLLSTPMTGVGVATRVASDAKRMGVVATRVASHSKRVGVVASPFEIRDVEAFAHVADALAPP